MNQLGGEGVRFQSLVALVTSPEGTWRLRKGESTTFNCPWSGCEIQDGKGVELLSS